MPAHLILLIALEVAALAAFHSPGAVAQQQSITGEARATGGGQVIVKGNRIVLQDISVDAAAPETQRALSALVDGHVLT
jgi:hypothetical protein